MQKFRDSLLRIFKWENARIILLVLVFCGLAIEAVYSLASPAIPLLPPRRDGTWIRPDHPADLAGYFGNADNVAVYRKRFVVSGQPRDIVGELTAFKDAAVFLDGQPIRISAPSSWKSRIRVVLPRDLLAGGPHELLLKIGNRLGAPLFHLSSDFPGLGDIDGWEFSQDGIAWKRAARGDDPFVLELRSMFPTVLEGLRGSLWLLVPLFAGSLLVAATRPRSLAWLAAPGNLRIALLGLWLILGLNNAFKLPIFVGFDSKAHMEYCDYILQNHRLPTAADGFQMFQPPLYYLATAALYWVFSAFLRPETSLYLLRIVPLACGLLLVDLSARILRELYPDREDLQSCGLVVGGLLPMNLYMCQYFGNEPLTAVLTALLLYLAVATFRKRRPIGWKDAALLGAVGGLAMLAKATPVLLMPVVFVFLLFVPREEPFGPGARVKMAGLFLLVAGAVSGWFYARNWIIFGKPFVGGWDPLRNIQWWQDPGYRTVLDFFRFGEVFRQPIYAVFNGFADGVYSTFWTDGYLSGMASLASTPHWNYLLLAAGIALSLVPASAMGVGVAVAFRRAVNRESWPHTFLLATLFVYLAALVHLYVSLPICSTAKATYMTGLTPGFSVMAAAGAGLFVQRKYIGPLFVSLLATWAVTAYLGYMIR